jgi:hypothetical protein
VVIAVQHEQSLVRRRHGDGLMQDSLSVEGPYRRVFLANQNEQQSVRWQRAQVGQGYGRPAPSVTVACATGISAFILGKPSAAALAAIPTATIPPAE